jgi:hypothetical protein
VSGEALAEDISCRSMHCNDDTILSVSVPIHEKGLKVLQEVK